MMRQLPSTNADNFYVAPLQRYETIQGHRILQPTGREMMVTDALDVQPSRHGQQQAPPRYSTASDGHDGSAHAQAAPTASRSGARTATDAADDGVAAADLQSDGGGGRADQKGVAAGRQVTATAPAAGDGALRVRTNQPLTTDATSKAGGSGSAAGSAAARPKLSEADGVLIVEYRLPIRLYKKTIAPATAPASGSDGQPAASASSAALASIAASLPLPTASPSEPSAPAGAAGETGTGSITTGLPPALVSPGAVSMGAASSIGGPVNGAAGAASTSGGGLTSVMSSFNNASSSSVTSAFRDGVSSSTNVAQQEPAAASSSTSGTAQPAATAAAAATTQWVAEWDEEALLAPKGSMSRTFGNVRVKWIGTPPCHVPPGEEEMVTRLLEPMRCTPVFLPPETHRVSLAMPWRAMQRVASTVLWYASMTFIMFRQHFCDYSSLLACSIHHLVAGFLRRLLPRHPVAALPQRLVNGRPACARFDHGSLLICAASIHSSLHTSSAQHITFHSNEQSMFPSPASFSFACAVMDVYGEHPTRWWITGRQSDRWVTEADQMMMSVVIKGVTSSRAS